ncbi:MAG: DCC1-like thiol-disulfide oxidoreductase family protein, partial [Alphaproteobacteria bacterium]
RFVRFALKRDRDAVFHFVQMQSDLGQAILGRFELPAADWDSYVLVVDGIPSFKSAAFFGIMARLPAPWSWWRFGRVLPARPLDWLYDRIARNRYALFGKYDACMVPSPDVAARFLG